MALFCGTCYYHALTGALPLYIPWSLSQHFSEFNCNAIFMRDLQKGLPLSHDVTSHCTTLWLLINVMCLRFLLLQLTVLRISNCITLTLLLFRGEKLSPIHSIWRRPPDIIMVLLDIVVTNFFLLDWPCATVILVLHSLHQIMLGYGIYFLYLNNLIRLIVLL